MKNHRIWGNRRGSGKFESFVLLAFALAVILVVGRLVPIYYDKYQVNKALSRVAEISKMEDTDEAIVFRIQSHFQDRGLPNMDPQLLEIKRAHNVLVLHYEFIQEMDYPGIGTVHTFHFNTTSR